MDPTFNSNNKQPLFSLSIPIISVPPVDTGTFPNREYVLTSGDRGTPVTANLEDNALFVEFAISDATGGDLFYDSILNRFEVINYNELTGDLRLIERPPDDITGTSYGSIAFGIGLLFRPPDCTELYNVGRIGLGGFDRNTFSALVNKVIYQIDEKICETGAPEDAKNFLGDVTVIGVSGMTGQLSGMDRPPQNGDEWKDPITGETFVYKNNVWVGAPCCFQTEGVSGSDLIDVINNGETGLQFVLPPSTGTSGDKFVWCKTGTGAGEWIFEDTVDGKNFLGTISLNVVEGSTGQLSGMDRPPVYGDEWKDPVTGISYIYSETNGWQETPCCFQATGVSGSDLVDVINNGETGLQFVLPPSTGTSGDKFIWMGTGTGMGMWVQNTSQKFIETASTITGPLETGPFEFEIGDTFRFVSGDGIDLGLTDGASGPILEITALRRDLKTFEFDSFGGSGPIVGDFVTFKTDTGAVATVRRVLNNQFAWVDYYEPAANSFGTAFREGIDSDNRRNVYWSAHVSAGPRIDILKYTDAKEDLYGSSYPNISNYNITTPTNYKTEVAVDNEENVFVAGVFNGTIDFVNQGTSTTGAPSLSSSGGEDIFLGKFNDDGEWQWSFRVGGANNENEPSLDVDCCGNVYLAGEFTSQEIQFFDESERTALNLSGNTGLSQGEIFMTKIDPQGKALWSVKAENNRELSIPSVAVDGNKSIYLAFRNNFTDVVFTNADKFNTTTINKISGDNNDLILTKIDKTGKLIWSASIGFSGTDEAEFMSVDMATDDCGCVYLTANYTHNNLQFGDFEGVFNSEFDLTQDSNDARNAFLVKYNADGRPQWVVKASPDANTANLENLRVSVDQCSNVHWVGNISAANVNVDFYDFSEGNGGNNNSNLNVQFSSDPAFKGIFGFKISESGDGLYSYKVDSTSITSGLVIDVPNVSFNNCGDVFVIGRAAEDDINGSADIEYYNPGQAGSGGTSFSEFNKTINTSNSARFILKLANEVRSAPLIGNIQVVNNTTSVDVSFGGQITVTDPVTLNKNYYLDTDSGALTPKSANNGCKNRFIGIACGINEIILTGDKDLCLEPECNNVDILGEGAGPTNFRYQVPFATNGEQGFEYMNATVRSNIPNNVTIVRNTSGFVRNGTGNEYTVTIPADDDIQFFSLMDRSNNANGENRFNFIFNDSEHPGLYTSSSIIPVIPNTTIRKFGTNPTGPSLTKDDGQIIANEVSSTFFPDFTGANLRMDIRTDQGGGWFAASFSF